MSFLDLVLIAIVGGSVVSGFLAGFARAGIGFLAAITGVLFGFWFYGIPAAWVHKFVSSVAVSNLVGFLVVFVACVAAGRADRKTAVEAIQVDRDSPGSTG